jgi:hypothetical protein
VIWVALGAFALGAVAATRSALAQPAEPAQPSADESKVLTKDELATLVGKIALYPDDLVAVVLPASTYPLQVVEAARFIEERKKDSSLKPNEKWDDSVVALLNYPEVVKLMNDDLDWTWRLGDAVINQRADVLDAIQAFRDRAYAAGNLKSDEHQVVQNDDGAIAIKPADPQVVYVPYYEPERVVVYQTVPVYHYYPWGYPLYYYPYPYGYPFGFGFFWGVSSAFVIGWHSHYVHYYPCGYHGHPYYGHSYYGPNYVRNNVNGNVSVSRGGYVWQPHYVHGAQPFTRSDGRQLAVARHDPNAGGAPSGYRTIERGATSGYRADDRGAGAPEGYRANDRGAGATGGHRTDSRGGATTAFRSDGRTSTTTIAPHTDDNGAGAARGFRDGMHGAPPAGASRDGVRTIQPVHDRVTTQSVRDELRARESTQATFAAQSPGIAHSNGGATLERQHGSGSVERHTVIPQQDRRNAYPQQAPDHSAALRAAPPVRVAPSPVAPAPHSAPRTAPPQPSGGDAYAAHAPQSAPQRGDGGASSGRQGGGSAGHGAQGHAFEGRGGSHFR